MEEGETPRLAVTGTQVREPVDVERCYNEK